MRVSKLASFISLSLVLAAGPALAQHNVDKVFGGITAEAGQTYGSLESVNGGITIREGATVRIGGNAETVNGAISLLGAEVGGGLTTTNGDITLARGAIVRGGLLVEKPQRQWWSTGGNRNPRVIIGANSVVEGTLVFEREVELFVHPTAKIGTVTGATAQSFTDSLPPRDD
jgi:hypothetical protein